MTERTMPAPEKDCVIFYANGSDNKPVEMLRIAPDAFYVRGERVLQGKYEAQMVYETFRAWMHKVGMTKK